MLGCNLLDNEVARKNKAVLNFLLNTALSICKQFQTRLDICYQL